MVDEFGEMFQPPSPRSEDYADVFSVKKILDQRIKDGRKEYLVEWRGFLPNPESVTWELRDNLIRNFDCAQEIEVRIALSSTLQIWSCQI